MIEVIAVTFRGNPKNYSFAPGGETYRPNDRVMVQTARGMECGLVRLGNHMVADEEITQPLKTVLRRATQIDLEQLEINRQKEREAFRIGKQKIAAHKLAMKLVEVEYTFDGSKILFYFTADGRVDFRELVRDLAGVFRTRIELRQIGVRDESRLLGGLGICGRPFCCRGFLTDFHPVSIKMAKEQALSLNPTKISGTCGRLMCCLKYEQNVYDELIRLTPKVGALVDTPEGRGRVTESNVLAGNLKVRLDGETPDVAAHAFHRDEVAPAGKGAPAARPKSSAQPSTRSEQEARQAVLEEKVARPAEQEKAEAPQRRRENQPGRNRQSGGRKNAQGRRASSPAVEEEASLPRENAKRAYPVRRRSRPRRKTPGQGQQTKE